MQVKSAKFITSAARAEQFLHPDKPMIAVAGKSNAGKSTFINMLAGQKRLAKTSAAPGRTRLVNYFDFGQFCLADLPGYGYAAVSKEEQARWGQLLDRFFARREDVSHVFLLSDLRRDPSADDLQMVSFLAYHAIPFTVAATKCDKLSRMKGKERVRAVANAFGLGADNVIAVSGITGEGKDALLRKIEQIVSQHGGTEEQDAEE